MNDDLASTGPDLSDPSPGWGSRLSIVFVLIGAALSVTLGVYGREHTPTGRAIITFGFPTLLADVVIVVLHWRDAPLLSNRPSVPVLPMADLVAGDVVLADRFGRLRMRP
jgi:hypothetical protein